MYLKKHREDLIMESFEPKKLALLRILEILNRHTDIDHPLKHDEIVTLLEEEYGITVERKAIGRNISLLREAGYEIETTVKGSYLAERDFEDSELRLLIDGVLSSKHITARHSKDLINKLCSLTNKYFSKHVKNIYSVNEWNKTDNSNLFFIIDIVDEAIEQGKMVEYEYNKYGPDKQLHKSSFQRVSPYQLILHNQRYYLMGYSSYWGQMAYHRLDHITNIRVSSRPAVPITDVEGYKNGISYKNITASMPYMFSDAPERVTFSIDEKMIDHAVDWFGKDIKIEDGEDGRLHVTLSVSPNAMHYWALQFAECVDILSPESLRDKVAATIAGAHKRYNS